MKKSTVVLERDSPAYAYLSLAILWGRHDVLNSVLRQTGLEQPGRQEALQDALIEAIARNQVKAVEKLLHCGASIDKFRLQIGTKSELLRTIERADRHLQQRGVDAKGKRQECEERMKEGSETSAESTHRESWERLFSLSLSSGSQPAYIKMLSDETKESLNRRRSSILSRAAGWCSCVRRTNPSYVRKEAAVGESSDEPLQAHEMQRFYRLLSWKTSRLKKHTEEVQSRTDAKSQVLSSASYKSHLPRVYKELKVGCQGWLSFGKGGGKKQRECACSCVASSPTP